MLVVIMLILIVVLMWEIILLQWFRLFGKFKSKRIIILDW